MRQAVERPPRVKRDVRIGQPDMRRPNPKTLLNIDEKKNAAGDLAVLIANQRSRFNPPSLVVGIVAPC